MSTKSPFITEYGEAKEGISLMVEITYQANHSIPAEKKFVFLHTLLIRNDSPYTIKLAKKDFIVFDSEIAKAKTRQEKADTDADCKALVLAPDEENRHTFTCDLYSEVGSVDIRYLIQQLDRSVPTRPFAIKIPDIQLIAPSKLN